MKTYLISCISSPSEARVETRRQKPLVKLRPLSLSKDLFWQVGIVQFWYRRHQTQRSRGLGRFWLKSCQLLSVLGVILTLDGLGAEFGF